MNHLILAQYSFVILTIISLCSSFKLAEIYEDSAVLHDIYWLASRLFFFIGFVLLTLSVVYDYKIYSLCFVNHIHYSAIITTFILTIFDLCLLQKYAEKVLSKLIKIKDFSNWMIKFFYIFIIIIMITNPITSFIIWIFATNSNRIKIPFYTKYKNFMEENNGRI